MQWFKVPPKIYFEYDSIQYLEKMEGIERAFIVTDPTMVKLGYVDRILYYLRKRKIYCHSEIFSDVEPDPDVDTIMRGVRSMREFKPDVIIALGGGSAIDAAKGMWLFYEHPETDFGGLKIKFMDIRKRAFKFPKLGTLAKFVAIPTTSGTGSEVTAFSVITDRKNGNIKYPLTDYALRPDVAIIDPQFVLSLPKNAVADTGMDVLTHAIEAYISNMASDYTDSLALRAIKLVFEYLPRAYRDGNDVEARDHMANASCMAGMAFANAFLGVNHSLAHKLGAFHHIPHGIANALVLTDVMRYNADEVPTKMGTFPQYQYPKTLARYAEIGRFVGLTGKDDKEVFEKLLDKLEELKKIIEIKPTIKDYGVDEKYFLETLDEMSEQAFNDQCTGANPRYPLIAELKEIYLKAYYGK